MIQIVIGIIFVLAGLLNAYPAIGMLGAKQLNSLYGLDFTEANLLTLMQHRAVMLGLIGLFLIVAAFRRELQPAGLRSALPVCSPLWSSPGCRAIRARGFRGLRRPISPVRRCSPSRSCFIGFAPRKAVARATGQA